MNCGSICKYWGENHHLWIGLANSKIVELPSMVHPIVMLTVCAWLCFHDDVIKWKRGTLMFSLICVWTNGWVNNREAGDLRRHRAHYDVTVMAYGLIRTESIYTLHHYVARAIVRLRKCQRSKPTDEHGQLYHINPCELIITRKYNAIDVCWMVRTYNPQKIVWLFLIILRGRSAKSKT